MLNLSVEPLDGSPALTSAVQFAPSTALGTPTLSSSIGNGNYAATWLDSTISGLTGTRDWHFDVHIPANATANSAYNVHFDHASASPNGLAAFPKQTQAGFITLSSRTALRITTTGFPIHGGCAGLGPFTIRCPLPAPMPCGDGNQ